MKMVIGLGNPGKKFENTRHNVGFMVVDELLRKITPVEKTVWKENRKFNALVAQVGDWFLVKPQTSMNASGMAVKKLITNYQLPITNLWVIHDDLDLPLGKIKIRKSGGPGGHRGVESIIRQLGTDQFVRFRLGIGHPGPESSKKEVEGYVLGVFRPGEKSAIRKAIKKIVEAIKMALEESLEQAMNKFNLN